MWEAHVMLEPRESLGCGVVREGFLEERIDKLDLKGRGKRVRK